MIIGLKSPGPGCAHRSALAHRDWLSSSHRGARRSPPVATLPYSVFGLHRNLRCRCDLAPTRQSIGNSFHAGAGWGIFFLRFVYHLSKYWVLKCSPGVRFDAQGRPEGGVGRGDVYSVGPTPTLPLVRAPSFSRADAASPRRRPRVGPGRPQGSYKQTDTNNVASVSLRSGFWRRGNWRAR